MKQRCEEAERFRKVDAAFRAGDLAALRAAAEDPADIPNGPMPLSIGSCLEYAIYHSPLPFIRTLLEAGADSNPTAPNGFPPLIAALSCSRSQPGSPARSDVLEIVKLLLSFGADPNQRGIHDYTPLHMAAAKRNVPAMEVLLEGGADPRLRTRIDDYETPREMAESAGLVEDSQNFSPHTSCGKSEPLDRSSMRIRFVILSLVGAGIIGLLLAMVWPDQKMASRDIGCAKVPGARGKEICQALSESMEWTWMGHAIVSPGWRVTWKGLRRVYCREKMSVADLPVMEAMKTAPDWRLQDGSDDLIRLIGSTGGSAQESENSIFNPANPDYLLKGGCGGDQ